MQTQLQRAVLEPGYYTYVESNVAMLVHLVKDNSDETKLDILLDVLWCPGNLLPVDHRFHYYRHQDPERHDRLWRIEPQPASDVDCVKWLRASFIGPPPWDIELAPGGKVDFVSSDDPGDRYRFDVVNLWKALAIFSNDRIDENEKFNQIQTLQLDEATQNQQIS